MTKETQDISVLFNAWDGYGNKIINRQTWKVRVILPGPNQSGDLIAAAEEVIKLILIEQYGLGPNGEEPLVEIIKISNKKFKTKNKC